MRLIIRRSWAGATFVMLVACSRNEPASSDELTRVVEPAPNSAAGPEPAPIAPTTVPAEPKATATAEQEPTATAEQQPTAPESAAPQQEPEQVARKPNENNAADGRGDAPEPTADTRAAPTVAATGSAPQKDQGAVAVNPVPSPPIKARFRARPGRRLVGTAELHETEQGAVLEVLVRDASRGVERLRIFGAENCAEFGAGAGRFSSLGRDTANSLAPIGELRLEGGKGTREYRLDEGPARTSLRGKAVVAYAPVAAHADDVTEPIACAELPRS